MHGDIYLTFFNAGRTLSRFTVTDNSYGQAPQTFEVSPDGRLRRGLSLEGSHNWYDLVVTNDIDPTFIRRFAGHVETGQPSISDPTLSSGAVAGAQPGGYRGPVLFEEDGPECRLRCSTLEPAGPV